MAAQLAHKKDLLPPQVFFLKKRSTEVTISRIGLVNCPSKLHGEHAIPITAIVDPKKKKTPLSQCPEMNKATHHLSESESINLNHGLFTLDSYPLWLNNI